MGVKAGLAAVDVGECTSHVSAHSLNVVSSAIETVSSCHYHDIALDGLTSNHLVMNISLRWRVLPTLVGFRSQYTKSKLYSS
jgi:hypothetical protein